MLSASGAIAAEVKLGKLRCLCPNKNSSNDRAAGRTMPHKGLGNSVRFALRLMLCEASSRPGDSVDR